MKSVSFVSGCLFQSRIGLFMQDLEENVIVSLVTNNESEVKWQLVWIFIIITIAIIYITSGLPWASDRCLKQLNCCCKDFRMRQSMFDSDMDTELGARVVQLYEWADSLPVAPVVNRPASSLVVSNTSSVWMEFIRFLNVACLYSTANSGIICIS